MTDDQISEVRQFLNNKVNFFETYHVTEFEGYRRTKAGHDQKVTVRILDRGPEHRHTRYHCLAESEDGKRASGNAAESINTVLAIMHWFDLDKE